MKKVSGCSGLLGLCLPTDPDYDKDKFNPNIVSPRLVDNIKSGYAKLYDWTEEEQKIKKWIEDAFNAGIEKAELIDNSRLQFKRNKCE